MQIKSTVQHIQCIVKITNKNTSHCRCTSSIIYIYIKRNAGHAFGSEVSYSIIKRELENCNVNDGYKITTKYFTLKLGSKHCECDDSAPSLTLAVVKDKFSVCSVAFIQVLHNLVRCRGKRLVNVQELEQEQTLL
jgi:hypothetical protein